MAPALRPPQKSPDPCLELCQIEGLAQIVIPAFVQTSDAVRNGPAGAEEEDGDGAQSGVTPQLMTQLYPIEPWHDYVQHDHIRPLLPGEGQSVTAIVGSGHVVAFVQESVPHAPDKVGLVINDQDLRQSQQTSRRCRLISTPDFAICRTSSSMKGLGMNPIKRPFFKLS